ncbi:MAG: 4-hydroxy-3-methylbut-2-en-1-yl diphosphate synthase [Rhodospirillaceae bacterium]|nr:4-hydroxy-3-methylbut-2-en-1-yl diphosphate synthase [Rhodospirillaceae bacterium]|tara:strand:- start:271 stop:1392 length:1122 start_codon:yes stop_codon:yes gene_type:complete
MSENFFQKIKRKKTRKIKVGDVSVGGESQISVQSMTNTTTTNIGATVKQINQLAEFGADIVRVSCPDKESSKAIKEITQEVDVPIVADVHFHYQRGIESIISGASCLRINPGNIGSREKLKELVKVAKDYGVSMRVGVNAGSLEKNLLEKYGEPCPQAMVESATATANFLEDLDFNQFKISVKASNIFLAIESYRKLSLVTDAPLHLGVTEAGSYTPGTIKSSIGIASLLMDGIGDTLRVSLSSNPIDEIKVGFEILKSLGIRNRGLTIISCPSCARQGFPVIDTVAKLEKKFSYLTTPLTLSIIGCVVNGPGEAKKTDIAITGGKSNHMVYINGLADHKVSDDKLFEHLVELIETKINEIENKNSSFIASVQ